MIILDTNQLERARPPDGPVLAMLGKLGTQTGHRLWLPEVVLEEHLAHYRHDVEEADRSRQKAEAKLRALVPYVQLGTYPALPTEPAVQDRTHRLQQLFLIRQTPDGAWREALLREARRLPPAKVSWDGAGAGARDVAIWVTAVSACQEDAEQTYFVATDKAAFGQAALKPELVRELEERLGTAAQAFHYCNGVDSLLAELAAKHEPPPDRQMITAAEPVRQAVSETMEDPRLLFEITTGAGLFGGFTRSSPQVDDLTLVGVDGPIAYEIGDTIWACASTTWQATRGLSVTFGARDPDLPQQVKITFRVRTTLVMELGGDGSIASAEVVGRGQAFDIAGRA